MSSRRLAARLQSAGHDVVLATDVGLVSVADARVPAWAVAQDRPVLTRDHEDFTALHDLVVAVSGHHPGILVVRFDNDSRHNLTERAIAIALGTRLRLDVIDTLLDRRMRARFGNLGDPRRHRVQVDVRTRRQQRRFMENRDAFEPPLEKRGSGLVLMVGQSCQQFLQALHKPTQALQTLPRPRHPGRIQEVAADPLVRDRQRPPRLVPGRKQSPPAPHHLFVRPAPTTSGSSRERRVCRMIRTGQSCAWCPFSDVEGYLWPPGSGDEFDRTARFLHFNREVIPKPLMAED